MYAVVETGGKQYRVAVGEQLRVEKLPGMTGEVIDLPHVLAVIQGEDVKIGNPLLEGASVKAEVMAHGRDKKIRIFKMKRRKKYRRTQGHRQAYTQLKVTEISA
ncbi:MAG TPA: 50S ribosomal protein L21 [Gammaproteobacteria bacterium]|nr:50S ribosomal protein L21 [Gammaproteobacteria bacterium]